MCTFPNRFPCRNYCTAPCTRKRWFCLPPHISLKALVDNICNGFSLLGLIKHVLHVRSRPLALDPATPWPCQIMAQCLLKCCKLLPSPQTCYCRERSITRAFILSRRPKSNGLHPAWRVIEVDVIQEKNPVQKNDSFGEWETASKSHDPS